MCLKLTIGIRGILEKLALDLFYSSHFVSWSSLNLETLWSPQFYQLCIYCLFQGAPQKKIDVFYQMLLLFTN